MKIEQQSIGRLAVTAGCLGLVGTLVLFPWMLTNIFSATYLPHGFCFLWNPRLLWLHVVSDTAIGVSYIVIAASLTRLVQMCRREIPFQTIFLAFGIFILACGVTHLLAVVVLWKPLYWLEGDVKLLTAVASVITAIVLPLYLPRIQRVFANAQASAVNEQRFLAAAHSSLDSIYILKSIRGASGAIEDFRFMYVNPNAARLVSLEPNQVLGQALCELMPFNRTLGLFDKYRQVVETGQPIDEEFSIQEPMVGASWIKIKVVKLDDGLTVTASDITARKRLEFERTKAFTQSLIDSSPATIIVTDLAYTITTINPAAEKMLWYKPEELVGHQSPLIFYDPSEIETRARKLSVEYATTITNTEVIFFVSRAQQSDDEAEWTFIRKGGSRLTVQVTVTPLVGDAAENSGFMITAYDISERKRREEYISHISQHDALTGLPTRHLLLDRLEVTIARAVRDQSLCALLMIDLNDFKSVNDSIGHHAGDMLLVDFAKRMRKAIRKTDTIARMGGDEFVVVLGDLHRETEAVAVAELLQQCLVSPFVLPNGTSIVAGASIGICIGPLSGPDNSSDASSLLKCADIAMYQAKATGGRQIELYTEELANTSHRRQEIATGLRDALRLGEFELHYQPQVELLSGAVYGFECLLRWNNVRLGFVSPAEFVPIAEEKGLIQPIGAWVIKQACKDIQTLNRRWDTNFFVSVNLSPRQLEQPDLVTVVGEAIHESGIDPAFVEFEITEGVLMRESARTTTMLAALRSLGPRIAIDDFGAGFSNMSYLLRLPIDCLKIDRSIISGCSVASNSSTVAGAIIALGRQLNLAVVAEGAEILEEVEFLQRASCDRVQGFYFSRPLPLDFLSSLSLDNETDHVELLRRIADTRSF